MNYILGTLSFLFCFQTLSAHADASLDQKLILEFKTAAASALANSCYNLQINYQHNFCKKNSWDLDSIIYIPTDEALNLKAGKVTQECTAINEPTTKTIYFNRARWRAIQDLHYKEGIAFHEILSIYGQEHTGDYSFSAKYISFWKSAVTETPADAALIRSETPRTVVSDYNKFKSLFFSSSDIMYVTPGTTYDAINNIPERCVAAVASNDPGIPDHLFPIALRKHHDQENLRLSLDSWNLDDHASLSFEPTKTMIGTEGLYTEYTQTYTRGTRTEKLRVRVDVVNFAALKLEVYESDQLVSNSFVFCSSEDSYL